MEHQDEVTQAIGEWLLQTKGTWVKGHNVSVHARDYITADISLVTTPEAINELHQLINKPKMTKLTSQADAVQAVRASGLFIGSVDASGNFSMASNPTIQLNGTEARAEAKRLAKVNPGKLFFIGQLRGAELVPTVATLSI